MTNHVLGRTFVHNSSFGMNIFVRGENILLAKAEMEQARSFPPRSDSGTAETPNVNMHETSFCRYPL